MISNVKLNKINYCSDYEQCKAVDVLVQRACEGACTFSAVASTVLIVMYISHGPGLPQYHGWPHVSSRCHCGRHKNRTSLRFKRVGTAMLHLHLHCSPRAQAVSGSLPVRPLWAGVIRAEICKNHLFQARKRNLARKPKCGLELGSKVNTMALSNKNS